MTLLNTNHIENPDLLSVVCLQFNFTRGEELWFRFKNNIKIAEKARFKLENPGSIVQHIWPVFDIQRGILQK